MPKIEKQLTKELDSLPDPDEQDYILTFSEFTVDAGARAMYRAWQSTDVELSKTWEEADEDLKATFRRQFRTGLAGAVRDVGSSVTELLGERPWE